MCKQYTENTWLISNEGHFKAYLTISALSFFFLFDLVVFAIDLDKTIMVFLSIATVPIAKNGIGLPE